MHFLQEDCVPGNKGLAGDASRIRMIMTDNEPVNMIRCERCGHQASSHWEQKGACQICPCNSFIESPSIGELVCTLHGVIAESKHPLKGGEIVTHDLFQFKEGFEAPKAGDRMLCPKSHSHYVYFRNKETQKIVPVGGSIFHR